MKTVAALLFLAFVCGPACAEDASFRALMEQTARDEACAREFGGKYPDIAATSWQSLEEAAADRDMDIFGAAYEALHMQIMQQVDINTSSATLEGYCQDRLQETK